MRRTTSWRRVGCLALGLVLCTAAYATEFRYTSPPGRGPYPLPRIKQLVNDYTGVLTLKEASLLEKKLDRLEQRNGTQIVLLIIPSTGDEPMFDYNLRAFRTWDPGHNGQGNGVLFTIALLDGQWRISTGNGIQGALPDALIRRVMQDTIAPIWARAADGFDHEQVYKALDAGLEVLVSHAQQERTSPPNYSVYDDIPREWRGLAILVIGALTAYGLARLFRKYPVPGRQRAMVYVGVSVLSGIGAYYAGFHTTPLDDLMSTPADRPAAPVITRITTLPAAEDSDFKLPQLAETGTYTIVHFGSRSCPACGLLDDNLRDFLELRPDTIVKRFELEIGWDPDAVSQRYHLDIRELPFVQVYGPEKNLIATDGLPGNEAQALLYDWMEAEQRRAAGLRDERFSQNTP
jgi:uncharacterized membrane protein YgcG